MARTTIQLDDKVFSALRTMAERENRSTPNLIETILIRYLNEDFFVDEYEMQEIRNDKTLAKVIRQGMKDYRAGKGRFV